MLKVVCQFVVVVCVAIAVFSLDGTILVHMPNFSKKYSIAFAGEVALLALVMFAFLYEYWRRAWEFPSKIRNYFRDLRRKEMAQCLVDCACASFEGKSLPFVINEHDEPLSTEALVAYALIAEKCSDWRTMKAVAEQILYEAGAGTTNTFCEYTGTKSGIRANTGHVGAGATNDSRAESWTRSLNAPPSNWRASRCSNSRARLCANGRACRNIGAETFGRLCLARAHEQTADWASALHELLIIYEQSKKEKRTVLQSRIFLVYLRLLPDIIPAAKAASTQQESTVENDFRRRSIDGADRVLSRKHSAILHAELACRIMANQANEHANQTANDRVNQASSNHTANDHANQAANDRANQAAEHVTRAYELDPTNIDAVCWMADSWSESVAIQKLFALLKVRPCERVLDKFLSINTKLNALEVYEKIKRALALYAAGSDRFDDFAADNGRFDAFATGSGRFDAFAPDSGRRDAFAPGSGRFDAFAPDSDRFDAFAPEALYLLAKTANAAGLPGEAKPYASKLNALWAPLVSPRMQKIASCSGARPNPHTGDYAQIGREHIASSGAPNSHTGPDDAQIGLDLYECQICKSRTVTYRSYCVRCGNLDSLAWQVVPLAMK
ncbi:MAG: hypothetical protein LBR89_03520 [Holosporales bacterium]|nr:hypothetical protein [Holosporales bacterium]